MTPIPGPMKRPKGCAAMIDYSSSETLRRCLWSAKGHPSVVSIGVSPRHWAGENKESRAHAPDDAQMGRARDARRRYYPSLNKT
jgi:hypothetical protein